jgi:CRP-like cAMP-binding protein
MGKLETIISEHYCFKGLEQNYLDMIIEKASDVSFDTSDLIFGENEKADKFYIIKEGIVALETTLAPDRDPITIQMLGEGDILGWGWLFPPYKAHFDAKAVAPTNAISMDGKFILEQCEKDHDLGYELLKRFTYIMQQRLQAVRLQNPNMYVVKSKSE